MENKKDPPDRYPLQKRKKPERNDHPDSLERKNNNENEEQPFETLPKERKRTRSILEEKSIVKLHTHD